MKKSLFVFRRDLRIVDNVGLSNALNESEKVICVFIFDPRQISFENEFRGDNAVQFLVESLEDLSIQLEKVGGRLQVLFGKADEVLGKLIETEGIEAVYLNRDYTPFSRKRDEEIAKVCLEKGVYVRSFTDLILVDPVEMVKKNKVYTVYTPFMKSAKEFEVKTCLVDVKRKIFGGEVLGNVVNWRSKIEFRENLNLAVRGGRERGIEKLNQISNLNDYGEKRDFPGLERTSLLSAYLKFGVVSCREVYLKIKENFGMDATLLNELYWREFFTHVASNFPRVFEENFLIKFNKLSWENDEVKFKRWCNGQTGFPIVDAGMRQLNATGYMHNRVRMVVASFLTKDLHIDWRWGEKYFAKKLVDYDPAVNNGNWQWVASTGCDAQPYFRIFNPWLQQVKFDEKSIYIKKWVEELREVDALEIHNLFKKRPLGMKYFEPMVEHWTEVKKAKEIYNNCLN